MKKKEITINIKDLLAEMIRKAWLIILCMVVMSALLTAVKYKSDVEEKNALAENTDLNEDTKLVEQYVAALEEQRSMEEYMEESVLITCNPYNTYVKELRYTITNASSDVLKSVSYVCEDYIGYGALMEDMAEESEKYSARALKEVIVLKECTSSDLENMQIVDVRILANNADQLEEITQLFKAEFEQFASEQKVNFGKYSFNLIEEYNLQIIQEDIINIRAEKNKQLETFNTNVKNIENSLTEAQKEKAKELASGEIKTESNITDNEESVDVSVNKKYLVMGLAVGFILAVFYILIVYYFSGSIKTKDEIYEVYDLSPIGACSVGKLNLFEKIAKKVFYNNKLHYEGAEYVASKICSILTNAQEKDVYFVGELEDNECNMLSVIVQKLNDNNINATYLGDVLTDINSVETIKKDTNIILVNMIRKTEYRRVESEIRVCNELGANLRGYISFGK